MEEKNILSLLKDDVFFDESENLHLSEIQDRIEKLNPNLNNKKNLDAEIRANLEKHSSDSKAYTGKEDLFQCVYGTKARKGVWKKRSILINDLNSTEYNHEIIIKNTTIYREISVRLVQSEFRAKLMKEYHYKCPLTNITTASFLIASHIKPWSKSSDEERLDANNGILLSVHLDNLFDKGMISFNDDGFLLCINNEVSSLLKDNFIINNKQLTSTLLTTDRKKYLDWHRKHYGFNNNNEVVLFNSKES